MNPSEMAIETKIKIIFFYLVILMYAISVLFMLSTKDIPIPSNENVICLSILSKRYIWEAKRAISGSSVNNKTRCLLSKNETQNPFDSLLSLDEYSPEPSFKTMKNTI